MAESSEMKNVSKCIRFTKGSITEGKITIDLNIHYSSGFFDVSISGFGDKNKTLAKVVNDAIYFGLKELLDNKNIEEANIEANSDNVSTT